MKNMANNIMYTIQELHGGVDTGSSKGMIFQIF